MSLSQDLEEMTQKLPEVDLDTVPMMEEPEDDLAQYTFPKFAVTYFQKSASHTHIRRPLRYPLLYHEDDTDCSVPGSVLSRGSGLPLAPREQERGRMPWALCCMELVPSGGSVSVFPGCPGCVEHHPAVHGRPSGASALHQEHPAWRLGDGADPRCPGQGQQQPASTTQQISTGAP